MPLYIEEAVGLDPRIAGLVAAAIGATAFGARIGWARWAEQHNRYLAPLSIMAIGGVAAAVVMSLGSSLVLLVWPAAVLKLVWYLARRERPVPGGSWLAPIRIGVGLLPALSLAVTGAVAISAALIGAVIGELIDRAEFYASLRFLTPTHQIRRDLHLKTGTVTSPRGP